MADLITGIPNIALIAGVALGAYCLYTEADIDQPEEDTDEE
jgi:hypothetical protein